MRRNMLLAAALAGLSGLSIRRSGGFTLPARTYGAEIHRRPCRINPPNLHPHRGTGMSGGRRKSPRNRPGNRK